MHLLNPSFAAEDNRSMLYPLRGSLLFSNAGVRAGTVLVHLGARLRVLGSLRMLSALSTRRAAAAHCRHNSFRRLLAHESRVPPHYYCESQPRTSALSLPVRRAVSVFSLEHRRRGAGDSVRRRSFSHLLSSARSAVVLLCGAVPCLPLPYVRAERERALVASELEQCHCGVLCTFLCERACRAGRESERGKSDGDTLRAQEGKVLSSGALWLVVWGSPGFGYVFTCFERTRRAAPAGTSIQFTGLTTPAPQFFCFV